MPDYQERETLVGEPTESHTPTFDTGGSASQPDRSSHWPPNPSPTVPPEAEPRRRLPTDPPWPRKRRRSEPLPAAHPSVVPGAYQYLKRWTFVLVVAGVWIVAAAIGLGLYYWWFHSFDKTPAVFVVLIFVIVCTVGGLLIAMVQNKPLMSALAVALMSAPLASVAGAAALYGIYFCDRVARCLVGADPLLG